MITQNTMTIMKHNLAAIPGYYHINAFQQTVSLISSNFGLGYMLSNPQFFLFLFFHFLYLFTTIYEKILYGKPGLSLTCRRKLSPPIWNSLKISSQLSKFETSQIYWETTPHTPQISKLSAHNKLMQCRDFWTISPAKANINQNNQSLFTLWNRKERRHKKQKICFKTNWSQISYEKEAFATKVETVVPNFA